MYDPTFAKSMCIRGKKTRQFFSQRNVPFYTFLCFLIFFFAMNLYSYNLKNNEAFFFFYFTLPLCFLLSLIGLQGKPLHFRFPW